MNILALIPARGGSKRLPQKNISELGGKPLVVWSIQTAKKLNGVCDVLVSTDNKAIASVSTDAGALVPWLRPNELATDSATSASVALHAIDWYEKHHTKIDAVLLLQPTSPFRTIASIDKGIQEYLESGYSSVISVSRAHESQAHLYTIEGGYLRTFEKRNAAELDGRYSREVFCPNGNFYITDPRILYERGSFLSENTIPIILDSPVEAVDIDTAADFKNAEAQYRKWVEENV